MTVWVSIQHTADSGEIIKLWYYHIFRYMIKIFDKYYVFFFFKFKELLNWYQLKTFLLIDNFLLYNNRSSIYSAHCTLTWRLLNVKYSSYHSFVDTILKGLYLYLQDAHSVVADETIGSLAILFKSGNRPTTIIG